MRIGLLSDTHIPEVGNELPSQLFAAFQGVDLILHAGDVTNYSVLDRLERVAPVLAALGDHDYSAPSERWQERHILKLEGHVIWLFHIRPYSFAPGSQPDGGSAAGEGEGRPDIVLFGHEHCTVVERSDGILYVNPGSPTMLDRKHGLGTVGLLELSSGNVDVRIIRL